MSCPIPQWRLIPQRPSEQRPELRHHLLCQLPQWLPEPTTTERTETRAST
jgi:hypothetical protein